MKMRVFACPLVADDGMMTMGDMKMSSQDYRLENYERCRKMNSLNGGKLSMLPLAGLVRGSSKVSCPDNIRDSFKFTGLEGSIDVDPLLTNSSFLKFDSFPVAVELFLN